MISKAQKRNAERMVRLADELGHLPYNDGGQTPEGTLNLSVPTARLVVAGVVTGVADTNDGITDDALAELEELCRRAVARAERVHGAGWWSAKARELGLYPDEQRRVERVAELRVLETYNTIREHLGHDYGGTSRRFELMRRRRELGIEEGETPAVEPDELAAAFERVGRPRFVRAAGQPDGGGTARTVRAWARVERAIATAGERRELADRSIERTIARSSS